MRFLTVSLIGLALALPAAADGSVEGRWVLTRQTYQGGGQNLAPAEQPVILEIFSGPEGPGGRVWVDAPGSTPLPWPSIVIEGRPLDVKIRSVLRTPAGGITATYTAVPAEGDDMVLEIRETYECVPGEDALEGTVEVRFTGGDRNRGGYVLHRRFERER